MEETRGGVTPGDEAQAQAQTGEADGGEARSDETRPGDAQAGDARTTGAPSDDARAEEERVEAVIDELRRLKVEDLALDMGVSLVTVGYQKLGLTEQTRVLRDLDGARLAIELLRALLEVLEREGEAAKLADLRGTLATMQLNYARAVAEGTATGPGTGGAAAEPPA